MYFISHDMTASFNVPDSISFGELENLAAERAAEESSAKQARMGLEPTQENINEAADRALNYALEICEDPMVHKVMMLEILNNMVDWHTRIGQSLIEDDHNGCGVAWLRDGGKLQAMMTILLSIEIGKNDWITE